MSGRDEKIVLQRDCEVISVPYGERKTLKQGTEVQIMQAMGGSHTVYTHEGMFRISGTQFRCYRQGNPSTSFDPKQHFR